MATPTKPLEITCPICAKVKIINVPEAIFSQKKFGTIKVQIPQKAVCEHQFIVFVDTKGIIRGYEKIDLLMTAAKPEEKEPPKEKEKLTLNKLLQMYGVYGVFSLLHAKIFKYKSYIMSNKENEEFASSINALFDRLLPEQYRDKSAIEFLYESDLNKIKLKEKDSLLIDANQYIIQTPWVEKLKFEESIVEKALGILNEEEQLILLEQDIARFIKEVEASIKIVESVKEIYEDDLIEKITKDLNIPKINHYRLSLIKEFLKQRISNKLPSKIKNKVEDFLNLL